MSKEKQIEGTCDDCTHYCVCPFHLTGKENKKCVHFFRKQVEVVRCADCAVPHNEWTGCPKLGGLVTTPDFYCAFARPKMKGGAE